VRLTFGRAVMLQFDRKSFVPLFFAVCLLALAACRKKPGSAPGKSLPGVDAKCGEFFTINEGPYRWENNTWGSGKARGRYEQCLLEREVDGKTERGWTWNFPGLDPSVFAYPEIIYGWKPWSGGRTTDKRFPLKVADVKHLVINYHIEMQATGAYNLAPEIWLTRSGHASNSPNPSTITTEIMFWMDYKAEARPAGSIVEHPVVDGVTYELWKADSIGDKGNGQGWVLYSFKSPKIQHQGTISVHSLLGYMSQKNLIKQDEYVASVEFGNEVMGGTGTTWVKRFDIEVRP